MINELAVGGNSQLGVVRRTLLRIGELGSRTLSAIKAKRKEFGSDACLVEGYQTPTATEKPTEAFAINLRFYRLMIVESTKDTNHSSMSIIFKDEQGNYAGRLSIFIVKGGLLRSVIIEIDKNSKEVNQVNPKDLSSILHGKVMKTVKTFLYRHKSDGSQSPDLIVCELDEGKTLVLQFPPHGVLLTTYG